MLGFWTHMCCKPLAHSNRISGSSSCAQATSALTPNVWKLIRRPSAACQLPDRSWALTTSGEHFGPGHAFGFLQSEKKKVGEIHQWGTLFKVTVVGRTELARITE